MILSIISASTLWALHVNSMAYMLVPSTFIELIGNMW
jgi:hypothetical protein